MIQRADNGLWAMPGGALEVGETPAEGVAREAWEETGIRCLPITLVGVFDSRRCGMKARHHLYAFLFLCRPLAEPVENPSHAIEVKQTGWFAEHALPEEIDPGHRTRIPEAFVCGTAISARFSIKRLTARRIQFPSIFDALQATGYNHF